ncbi:hypothetical protein [Paludisphaera soli]|uniref:hypothetical protein n=1 Tax=Paludisphaera soli TaxID=2712865 RepID=UPI0013EBE4BE|nr:hypothetical protein [Paludisphaera soli]
MKNRPVSAALLGLATAILLVPLAPGCDGDAEPPPMAAEDLAEVQKKQQEMIAKEYGPKAGKPAAKKP